MPWVETVALVVGGLAVGSFLNVVIYRLPRHESMVTPASHCPACNAPVRPWDNVPILSWLVLRGHCRACRTRIPLRYPIVEAVTALLFVGAGERFSSLPEIAAYCVLFAALVAISAIDLDHMIIPDRVVLPATLLMALILLAEAASGHRWYRFGWAWVGAAASIAAFSLIRAAYPVGMGRGDVKLSFLIGFALGWIRLVVVPVGFFLAFFSAAVVGLALASTGRGGRKTKIPFGPFLSVGAAGAVFWGTPIVRAWLGR